MHGKLLFLLLLSTLTLPLPASADPPPKPSRGIWFWQEGTHQYGSTAIVGDPVKEDQTISFLKSRGIDKVYGSYGNRPSDSAESLFIAAWNAKLHANGIESHFVVSNNTYIFPEKHSNMINRITDNLIEFNNDILRLPEEKFDALHFDVEPQGLNTAQLIDAGLDGTYAPWDSSLPDASKRDYVVMLFEMYGVARSLTTTELGAGFPIWADIPVFFDSLTSSVGWTDAAERDTWFSYAESQLDTFVMMAYSQSSLSSIMSGTNWEFTNLTSAQVRIALRATFGTGAEDDWLTLGDFLDMRDLVEDEFGYSNAIDIHDYRSYREANLFLAAVAVSASISLVTTGPGVMIEVDAAPQFVHFIQASTNLCTWKTECSFQVAQPGMERIPMSIEGKPHGFFQVLKYPIPQ